MSLNWIECTIIYTKWIFNEILTISIPMYVTLRTYYVLIKVLLVEIIPNMFKHNPMVD